MLGKPRLVPSRAALRLLRRLAYMSSGTACGTAALLLEDQRRKVHFATQIVDNANRLKQHPRRIHGVAEVSGSQSEPWLYPGRHDRLRSRREPPRPRRDSTDKHDYHMGQIGRMKLGDEGYLPGSKAPFLPSEVNNGYDKLSHRPGVVDDQDKIVIRPRRGLHEPAKRILRDVSARSSDNWRSTFRKPPPAGSTVMPIRTTAASAQDSNTGSTAFIDVRPPEAEDDHPSTMHHNIKSSLSTSSDLLDMCSQSTYEEIRALAKSLSSEPVPIQRLTLLCAYTRLQELDTAVALIPSSKITKRIPRWKNALAGLLSQTWRSDEPRAAVYDRYHAIQLRIRNRVLKAKLHRHMLKLCIETKDIAAAAHILGLAERETYAMDFDVNGLCPLLLEAMLSQEWVMVGRVLSTLKQRLQQSARDHEQTCILDTLLSDLASTTECGRLVEAIVSLHDHCEADAYALITSAAIVVIIRQGAMPALEALLSHTRAKGVTYQLTPCQAHGALRQFYITRRPTALQLKLLVDTIDDQTSESNLHRLEALLDEASAYDLRKMKGLPGGSNHKREGLRKGNARAHERLADRARQLADDVGAPSELRTQEHLQLLLSFSLDDYDTVITSSRKNLSPAASDMVLESRIRQRWTHGFADLSFHPEHDVALCVPAFQAKVRSLVRQKVGFDEIVALLWRYYKASTSQGRPVSHYLTVTAAKELINFRMFKEAVTLLRAIDTSTLAAKHALDIAAMTVLLHAYVKLRDEVGILWVHQRVLASNQLIDLFFVRHIGRLRKEVLKSVRYPDASRKSTDVARALESLRIAARSRRSEQQADTRVAGKAIVELFGISTLKQRESIESHTGMDEGTNRPKKIPKRFQRSAANSGCHRCDRSQHTLLRRIAVA